MKTIKMVNLIVLVCLCLSGCTVKANTEAKVTKVVEVVQESFKICQKEVQISNDDDYQQQKDGDDIENNNNIINTNQNKNYDNTRTNSSEIINIPNVCSNAQLSVGSTQGAVDQYDICIMTEANNSNFGDGRPILLGGHNTKSLKYLYKSNINDVISVNYNNNFYQYEVVYSNECTNDGQRLYDINTGVNMLDYSLKQEILYIYTCYGSNNWLVKAVRI